VLLPAPPGAPQLYEMCEVGDCRQAGGPQDLMPVSGHSLVRSWATRLSLHDLQAIAASPLDEWCWCSYCNKTLLWSAPIADIQH